MNVLVVEDNPQRQAWFRTKFIKQGIPDPQIHFAENPETAIDFLKIHSYSEIWLDHDLLPEHYDGDTKCNKTTGLAVAKWLGQNYGNNRDANITIHSRNWNGVGRMVTPLIHGDRKVLCYPFHLLSGLRI